MNVPKFTIGQNVQPSPTCRLLYGDPDYFQILEINTDHCGGFFYRTSYSDSVFFSEHELSACN